MKSKVILIILGLIGIIAIALWQLADIKQPEAPLSQPTYRALTLDVEGMVCPQCASIINIFLGSKEGILQSAIEYKEGGGTIVYDPEKITKEKILSFGILKNFYEAELVSDEIFVGEVKLKPRDVSPKVAAREKKLKEATAMVQLFLRARQKQDEQYARSLKEDYFTILNELAVINEEIQDKDEKKGFRKRVLAETSDQIYLVRPSLPGEPGYEIKTRAQELQIKLAVNPVLKAKSVFLAGNMRLNEAQVLFDQAGQLTPEAQVLIGKYQESLKQTVGLLELIREEGQSQAQLLVFGESVKGLIRQQLPKQLEALIEIFGQVPADISGALQDLEAVVSS